MSSKRGLFIRLDKIGDLCMTLPADRTARQLGHEVEWFIAPGLEFIATHSSPSRDFVTVSREFGWARFWSLVRKIKSDRPDYALSFFSPWWLHLALVIAGVPLRFGVRSKWHSYLFLNRGLRQKRSTSEASELQNNVELANWALRQIEPSGQIDPSALSAQPLLLSAPALAEEVRTDPYVVIHPGMAGSARNWPAERYIELIKRLSVEHMVVITGTATDRAAIAPIYGALERAHRVHWMNEKLNATQLLGVLARAMTVVAPSTGVLHLAAALGRPTVGLYSPVFVQHPRRWGAQGDLAENLLPDEFEPLSQGSPSTCPGHFSCLGSSCPLFDCMQRLSVDRVEKIVRAQISRGGSA